MKKLLGIIVVSLLLSGNVNADLNGYGEVKLNQYNVNEFEHYLSDEIHGSKSTQKKYGTGLVFAITLDGTVSGYYYCHKGDMFRTILADMRHGYEGHSKNLIRAPSSNSIRRLD